LSLARPERSAARAICLFGTESRSSKSGRKRRAINGAPPKSGCTPPPRRSRTRCTRSGSTSTIKQCRFQRRRTEDIEARKYPGTTFHVMQKRNYIRARSRLLFLPPRASMAPPGRERIPFREMHRVAAPSKKAHPSFDKTRPVSCASIWPGADNE